ncbi:hypothetical protein GCM10010885_08740 [Alicyclobacillus cellulosilyticus]|uniref:Rhodanese domain-containing protein n=1 Tax=Alicyclobacillus cellulosilyticus TaxID=1003997 RepID=A0A917K5H7_9BACL|nr:rhodanese-like domain-containing protein [Alicyclobacillus cellulosilyticus]GGJ01784.1 hypothetical protein GCM10010885_08740 [Alicyclobacillus cellulosilyticus]
MLITVDDVRDVVAGRRDAVLIDARAPERYRGETEPLDPKAGHIPGAVNRPWQEGLGEDGRWLPPELQRARFRDVLADGSEVIAYCGSGVTACANLFALALAGKPDARLYAGSWSDWCSYPEHPVATGP